MKIQNLYGGANLFISIDYKKSNFQLTLDGVYHKNTTADLQLSEIDREQIALNGIYTIYNNLSVDNWATNIEIRWNYTLTKNRNIFLKLNWQHNSCENSLHKETLQAHCGLVF